jgi:hypothetical protein
MANYYGAARSNYFLLKDPDAFIEAVDDIQGLEYQRSRVLEEPYYMVYSSWPNGWPSLHIDNNGDEIGDFDVLEFLSDHLADGEVAIIQEVGHEKLRYLFGQAMAINNKKEKRSIDLNLIMEMALELKGEENDLLEPVY